MGTDRRWWWAVALAVVAILLLIVLLFALSDGDDDTSTGDTSTTSLLATTTTAGATTTTVVDTTTTTEPDTTTTTEPETTTTTEPPPPTVPPGLCSAADDPEATSQVLYQAFTFADRDCAEQLATDAAIDTLFAIPGAGGGWTFQGCTEQDLPDPHFDCAYTFTGGATHFRLNDSAIDGWTAYEVYQTTD